MRLTDIRPCHLKFGYSSAREYLRGIEVFLNPSHHAEQMPWIRFARRRISRGLRARMEHFRFFFEPSVETFGLPWSESHEETPESELDRLGSDDSRFIDAVVKRLNGARKFGPNDIARLRSPRSYRVAIAAYVSLHRSAAGALEGFMESPSRSRESFWDMVRAFYAEALAEAWGSIGQKLLDDINMRRRILREQGVAATLRTLSPDVSIQSGRQGVVLEMSEGDTELSLGDRGALILTPSYFSWPRTQALFFKGPSAPRCVVTYPLPPLPLRARRIYDRQKLLKGLEALADPVRLRIAELLRERELSTRELAGFLTLSEPLVSRHLRRLLECGLVSQQRNGYFVMYRLDQSALKRIAQDLSRLT